MLAAYYSATLNYVSDKFTYEYNFFTHWLVDIRVEKITQSATAFQPRCIKGNGHLLAHIIYCKLGQQRLMEISLVYLNSGILG